MDEFNLEDVRIASPCKASWRKMKGDDRVRNCAKCELNVYNISEMTREEAAELIANTEGRLCIRLWRRRDGTVITKDCPMAFKQIRYGIAVFSSIIVGAVLATMQWTNWFTKDEIVKGERFRDLEAGMKAVGRIVVVNNDLPPGHRILSDDLREIEVDYRKIPKDSVSDMSRFVGRNLKRAVARENILTVLDVDLTPQQVFSGDKFGIDLDLSPDEIQGFNIEAKKEKTSVSNLMRRWILHRIKQNERN